MALHRPAQSRAGLLRRLVGEQQTRPERDRRRDGARPARPGHPGHQRWGGGRAPPQKDRRAHPPPSAAEVEEDVAEERRRYLDDAAAQGGHDPLLAERMRQLEPGDWLRLTSLQGETIAVKVAWLSPLTSRLLLVNRRGVRALVASAEELAVLASNGRLVVGAERTAFDEAMRQVRRHLDRVI
ncbi:DUF1631 family protein [Streptomyces sp. NPDC059569]|uniref:DUF1631 family protein n=1 Tax=Streptomyces sp. NPDC059569 TaxID=3346869 RepID=UPI0036840114